MRVLHPHKVKILFPIRALLQQGRWTVTHFHPPSRLVGTEPRIIHIPQVFAFCHGSPAEALVLNGLQQIAFAACPDARSDKISHTKQPTAARQYPAFAGTGSWSAYQSIARPACPRGHKQSSSESLPPRTLCSPCVPDRAAPDT